MSKSATKKRKTAAVAKAVKLALEKRRDARRRAVLTLSVAATTALILATLYLWATTGHPDKAVAIACFGAVTTAIGGIGAKAMMLVSK